jgi:hypothetical protein
MGQSGGRTNREKRLKSHEQQQEEDVLFLFFDARDFRLEF